MPDLSDQISLKDDRARQLASYRNALALTNGLIDPAANLVKDPVGIRRRAIERMERLRLLLTALGDPHLAYRVIHIGGTSGKGSTAIATSSLLIARGISTGLHTSPYLQSATEKIQINGQLVSSEQFEAATEAVIAAAHRAGFNRITYGEGWFAIVALVLAWAKVEVAVIEVGAGGRFDLTNHVEPEVSVITSVGMDHMETLGGTIEEIAWHKAGIIKPGKPVVIAVSDPSALAVIQHESETLGSPLFHVVAGNTFQLERADGGYYDWWMPGRSDERHRSRMPGRFQAINGATALTTVELLLNEELPPETVRAGLAAARLPGRWEVMPGPRETILDGAHNPEKSAALVRDLRARKRERPRMRLVIVAGVLEVKDRFGVLRELVSVADELVATSPSVIAKPGSTARSIAQDARELGFSGEIHERDNPREAVELGLHLTGPDDLLVVTGSLYLVGNVRGRWYPDEEVVLQQTSWPQPVDAL